MKKIIASLLTMFSSIAVFAIGKIRETSSSYNSSLVVAGVFVVLLVLLIVPLPVIKNRKRDQEKGS